MGARMLANIRLQLLGHSVTVWPGELVGTDSIVRGQYIEAIRAADDGNYDLLMHLHRIHTPTPARPLVVHMPATPPVPFRPIVIKSPPPADE